VKTCWPLLLGTALLVLAPQLPARSAPFTLGNVVVERIGDGATTLGNTASAIAVLEYTTGGTPVQTISFPGSGATQQTDSGTATSNGYLTSHAGFISVPGYNVATGTAGVASGNTKVNSILGADGTVVSRTTFPTGGPTGTPPSPFSGNNYRSSIATSATTFYATGTASGSPSTGGVWYFDGTNFTQVSSTAVGQPTNVRNVEIFGNQLYVSTSTGSFLGISAVGTGLPTTGSQTVNLVINGGTGASPYGFVMFATGAQGPGVLDLAYVADDRATTGGGLQKWTFNGSAWTNSWSLLVSSTSTALTPTTTTNFFGLRGLTGSWDPLTGARLFATTVSPTSNNAVISISDAGTTPTSYTTVASAGANYVFRGVDLVTVPEPSMLAAFATGIGAVGLWVRQRRKARR